MATDHPILVVRDTGRDMIDHADRRRAADLHDLIGELLAPSGDSNTTTVIAGMLFGCSTGTNGIPVEFLVDLELKEEIAWSASLMEETISESLKRTVPGGNQADDPDDLGNGRTGAVDAVDAYRDTDLRAIES